MSDELEIDQASNTPIWAAFGDLMSVLVGTFVLILVGVIAVQAQLSHKLDQEMARHKAEMQRRAALQKSLAAPIASGRVTLVNGRIGIRGNVLFAINSDTLQPEGQKLLKSLAGPLSTYLQHHDEILMVSGFTDDRPVHQDNRRYADNWELSAERALTVTRELIADGMAPSSVFAAAFGAQQPVSSNASAKGRAANRRVEIAPIPRSSTTGKSESP
ncbi:OmpA family protein [Oleiagrimonas sp. C23AA]|uniref:OmpA family protein n=1 Tax=Oleiagrimonas sp. C23AA TaxID=2719047 RepID=UPI0014221FC0|nr:OmpA family protein [Oleiagrimonas sp. C23AA]NII09112.1 OmpA family protein [Oleiagrimonas sp. C23AA]